MSVKVKDTNGEVREFTFIVADALELFLRELPAGWEVVT